MTRARSRPNWRRSSVRARRSRTRKDGYAGLLRGGWLPPNPARQCSTKANITGQIADKSTMSFHPRADAGTSKATAEMPSELTMAKAALERKSLRIPTQSPCPAGIPASRKMAAACTQKEFAPPAVDPLALWNSNAMATMTSSSMTGYRRFARRPVANPVAQARTAVPTAPPNRILMADWLNGPAPGASG
jgi:hypothetical protein